jgi:hypothetical protein
MIDTLTISPAIFVAGNIYGHRKKHILQKMSRIASHHDGTDLTISAAQ